MRRLNSDAIEYRKGFSLIELVVAMAIMVILGGITMLGVNAYLSRNVDKYASELRNQVDLVRQLVQSRPGCCRLRLYEDAEGYHSVVEYSDDGVTEWQAAPKSILAGKADTSEGDSEEKKLNEHSKTSEITDLGRKTKIVMTVSSAIAAPGETVTMEKELPGTQIGIISFDPDTGALLKPDRSGIVSSNAAEEITVTFQQKSDPSNTAVVVIYPRNGYTETR